MQHPKFTASPRMNPILLMCGWLSSAALIAVMAAPVHADKDGKDSGKGKYDADGDGKISLEEFKFKDKGLLKKLDSDGNGTVTASELAEGHAAMEARVQEGVAKRMNRMKEKSEKQFAAMDSNDDGSVTTDEIKAHAFSQMDKDNDGFLTRKELRHMWRKGDRGKKGKSRRYEGKSHKYDGKSSKYEGKSRKLEKVKSSKKDKDS